MTSASHETRHTPREARKAARLRKQAERKWARDKGRPEHRVVDAAIMEALAYVVCRSVGGDGISDASTLRHALVALGDRTVQLREIVHLAAAILDSRPRTSASGIHEALMARLKRRSAWSDGGAVHRHEQARREFAERLRMNAAPVAVAPADDDHDDAPDPARAQDDDYDDDPGPAHTEHHEDTSAV